MVFRATDEGVLPETDRLAHILFFVPNQYMYYFKSCSIPMQRNNIHAVRRKVTGREHCTVSNEILVHVH